MQPVYCAQWNTLIIHYGWNMIFDGYGILLARIGDKDCNNDVNGKFASKITWKKHANWPWTAQTLVQLSALTQQQCLHNKRAFFTADCSILILATTLATVYALTFRILQGLILTLKKEKTRLKVCWTLSPKADVDWKHTKKDDGKKIHY